jgi:parallel beta-helix repeat protein
MERLGIRTGLSLALALCAVAALGALYVLLGPRTARAAQSLTVCPAGPPTCDFASVQAAVDAASDGDVIKVARGTYSDVHSRSAPTGYPDPPDSGVILQVVYIDKSITLRGGYSSAFADPPNPEANPTTLDAHREGRVLCMIGEISPTVEGVRLTGGDATGLGGNPWEGDAGGGVYVLSAAATISGSQFFGNNAEFGGGLFLAHSVATLLGNTLSDNLAAKGAGLFLYHSPSVVSGNIIASNGGEYGGGLLLWNSAATLDHNTIVANDANWGGGGLYASNSPATLSGNTISMNSARWGGGLSLYDSDAILSGNDVLSNTAVYGGGLYLGYSAALVSSNTVFSNTAGYDGGGLYLRESAALVSGNTVFSNTAGYDGGGLYLRESGATLSGNMVFSNTAIRDGGGLYLLKGDTAVSGNIFSSNTANRDGGGVYLSYSPATLNGNAIVANAAAGTGGGLCLYGSLATLSGNTISANSADSGGGLHLMYQSDATLTNNVVVDNQASKVGGGLSVSRSSPRLLHTTIARNVAAEPAAVDEGDGSGVLVTGGSGILSSVTFTNTILVRHTVGITVSAGNTVTLVATLWGDGDWANGADWDGAGTVIISTGDYNDQDDPAFVDPDAGDYHILPDSAAMDVGVEAGVRVDVDPEPRPYDAPDLGADEYWPPGVLKYVYLPVVLRLLP